MKKLLYGFAIVLLIGVLAACRQTPEETLIFTVTFDTGENGTVIPSQEVENGGKVTKPADPTRDGFMFDGDWMNGNFKWNFDLDIVTDDLTLVATWIEISSTPTAVSITDELFSSTLTWRQTDADLQTFKVSLRKVGTGNFVEVEGAIEVDTTDMLHVVTFTPDVLPEGGYYDVKIEVSGETVNIESILFGGAGTEQNPYVVTKASDVVAILEQNSLSQNHFKQLNDILSTLSDQIEINNDRKVVFGG
ncbi:MAG: InlB B-repeat-containing protein, partial [Acholeplasmataceae bacterium]